MRYIQWLGLLGACLCSCAHAGSLQVQPVSMRLSSQIPRAVLRVRNLDASPVDVQVRVFAWTQPTEHEQLSPTSELRVSPPIQRIPANSEQIVRIVAGDAPAGEVEQAYRLIIDELPPSPGSGDGVKLLMRYSIPVFVAGRIPSMSEVGLALRLEGHSHLLEGVNTGTGAARLSNLRIEGADGEPLASADGLIGYLLPQARRAWPVQIATAASIPAAIVIDIDGHEQRFATRLD